MISWSALHKPAQRAVRKLAYFSSSFSVDAAFAYGALDVRTLEKLLAAGVFEKARAGFAVDPTLRKIALAARVPERTRRDEVKAFGEWLLGEHERLTASVVDSKAAFDVLVENAADVRNAFGLLSGSAPAPALAARLWCAYADVLFYTRVLSFDIPEYEQAVACADRGRDAALRAQTRIYAGRAVLEVQTPEQARPRFEEAIEIGGSDEVIVGDAVRGLGWAHLAGGDFAGAKSCFERAASLHEDAKHARGIADACMALGLVARLHGDDAEASRLFFRAEAILRARRDTIRLMKLGSLRKTLGFADERLPEERSDLDALLGHGQYWRAALFVLSSDDAERESRARVLADLAGVAWKELLGAASPPGWRLEKSGLRSVLIAPDGKRHDITRRTAFVRMLDALATSQRPLSPSELFEAAWPEQRIGHEAAVLRVYTTVRRLRQLGVPIATSGDGYFCENIRGCAP